MKTCSIEGCDRKQNSHGLCATHDRRRRAGRDLEVEIRAKAANGTYSDTGCVVEGCGKRVNARGLCATHYDRWARYGDPTFATRALPGEHEGCEAPGCRKPHLARGLCAAHYRRDAKGQDMSAPLREPTVVCSVEGCGGEHSGLGYCVKHYTRVSRHGDPNVGARETLDPDAPAVVYVVRHPHLGAGKVGVGNPDGLRVLEHTKRGWQVVWLSDTMTRAEARQVEKALLSIPPALGVLGPDDMPQNGHTETFDEQWLAYVLEAC